LFELQKSWDRSEKLLKRARDLLPDDLFFEEALDFEMQFKEYLSANEFGLALDCADQMGLLSNAPDDYWSLLEKAALNMGLPEEAQRFNEIRNS